MARMKDGTVIALFGIGALAAWYFSKNSAAAQAAGAAGSMLPAGAAAPIDATAFALPGSSASTAEELAAAGSGFAALIPVAAITSGYINFPSGTQAAAADFSNGLTRMDASGNYYVQWAGQTYLLGSMDAQGNWPATLVNS